MKEDRFDGIIAKGLKEEYKNIKMSSVLRNNIIEKTLNKKETPYEKFIKLMDTTVEISIPSLMIACTFIFVAAFTSFRVTDDMKRDQSIRGYTSVKIVKIGGADVIVDRYDDGGLYYEKNKD